MDILIVVDMQNDFVSGALGTQEAVNIVPCVVGRVVDGINRGEEILFTRDTHGPDYLNTQEGKKLPVPHCVQGTEGCLQDVDLCSYKPPLHTIFPTFLLLALRQAISKHLCADCNSRPLMIHLSFQFVYDIMMMLE